MNALLLALNAKYTHSNIAVRYLQKYAAPYLSQPPQILELTINNRLDFVLAEIFRRSPDLLFFSTYIWNVSMVRSLAVEYRKLCPHTIIGAGGPEVTYESESFLRQNPAFDLVIRGEGEETVRQLLAAEEAGVSWRTLPGLTVRENGGVRSNPPQKPLDLGTLPFPYAADFSDAPDKIKYYESSRGCPFQCQYCLSSVEKGVRTAPLDKVFADLKLFLKAKVRQVKFVDRTFNCDSSRALAIWRFLRDHDNGVTNFHFEITAELLDRQTLDFLRTIRPEQFQFEIGVQSTNPKTLAAIRRQNDWDRLSAIVKEIHSFSNIHQHLDLIAGLPYEDYHSFHQSFNDVYALAPQQLQLGFLKILKGAGLFYDQQKYGLISRSDPPFEVLSTPDLPYKDTLRLKAVEEMVELYYNSGRFFHTLRWLLSRMDDPFSFYQALGDRWQTESRQYASQSLEQSYTFFYRFCADLPAVDEKKLVQFLKLDYCLHQRPKRRPDWFPGPDAASLRRRCLLFLQQESSRTAILPSYSETDPQYLYKLVHFEPFSLDVLTGQDRPVVLLFDYRRRDLLGNARVLPVSLPEI
ncbi:MAG: B12-binding domain-containing radical SAM protein [Oscillospiraceae bacterium]|nr:B12-binding domain-containing radical SAM protein [Oscillospiraceae bacterium]